MAQYTDKYGVKWNATPQKIDVEFHQIRRGAKKLEELGRSLFFHYRAAFSILWPQDDHNRWSDLILKTYCENEITVLMGCSDSCKTYTMSKIALVDYWCFPNDTLSLVSTTEGRGAELRIWGCIKDLFNQVRNSGHEIAGNPIDYLKTITTDSVDEDRETARSLKRGIIIIPCKSGGVSSGLAPYIGIKARRLRHFGDEVAVMSDAFLNAYANWYGKEDFKGVMSGNFMETDDPLGRAAEPADGWDSFVDTEKTQTWRGKFYDSCVVALDGRDSPNFDYPSDQPTKFPYLIGKKKLDGISKTHGKDSWEWYSQCCGKPVKGMDIWRVLSKDFCRKHNASDEPVWDGERTQIYALDPAYGGGDRCVGRKLEFGRVVSGEIILRAGQPEVIPVSAKSQIEPEDQIAAFIKTRLSALGIPVENCFYDSFGRGTLGFSFAKVFGAKCPVPIDSGMKPTARPVRFDLFIEEPNGKKRLKRCDEHYTKFITELWFSAREVIGCGQMRNLDAETISEGCARKFTKNEHAKLEVEPKDVMKERTNKSPDLMDNLCIGVEGARQRGFKIRHAGIEVKAEQKTDWLDKTAKEFSELQKKRQLTTA